ncbi:MAG: NAD-dependent epimerase/dehydratase family protein [Anaerolineaceae bacterium]|nr:NAD-dependent epimerase/dehydratase family protein [Anaerolineaceae bacterium]
MKVFITGATGFIGGHVAKKLLEQGYQVVALVRNPHKAVELDALGAQLVIGDIRDKESMRKGMQGADQVYHIAAWYKVGSKDRATAEAINIQGTRNVMELIKELEIPRCVYTSTIAVHSNTYGHVVDETYRFKGKHLSIYDETKWKAHYNVVEPMVKEGLPVITVMPGVVYGPGDTSAIGETFLSYLNGKLPIVPRGTAYNWSHVDDIAEGHLLAMEKGKTGECYHLTGPAYYMEPVLKMAEEITGVPAPKLIVHGGLLKLAIPFMAFLGLMVNLPPTFTAEGLRIVANVTYLADSGKARKELGFTTRPLEEGLKETLVFLQQLRSS